MHHKLKPVRDFECEAPAVSLPLDGISSGLSLLLKIGSRRFFNNVRIFSYASHAVITKSFR